MSLPIDQQSPPAPGMQQPYGGSVGPVIGVLVVIIVFAVVAVVVGRLCSGRSIMGYGHFDLERWAEVKCSSCIDGRVSSPSPRVNVSTAAGSLPAATMSVQTQQDEPASQNPPPNA
ncbi:uncharacterized protein LOC111798443 [Cucurbita pepo subsp. pepo]|uniref:uncharacterized protein LOC111798443 n=1 Tax=Cucurbita pepo subsp. pepo TaxID=3664 RepID=UPI000C9D5C98|nr:uncharacterized protein LOC111798443 [Cucurbita pepo subsp. pepo]